MTLTIDKINITSTLEADLATSGIQTHLLRQAFLDFVNSNDSYEFGKAVGPGPNKFLWHAHMIPMNSPEQLEKWNVDYSRYTRCTSDRYLFYAKREPHVSYLLIDHVIDPGGHDLWLPKYKSAVDAMEKVADDFYFFNKIP